MRIGIGRESRVFQSLFDQLPAVDRQVDRLAHPDIGKQRQVQIEIQMLPNRAGRNEGVHAGHGPDLVELVKADVVQNIDFTDLQLAEHDLAIGHNFVGQRFQ